MLNKGLVKIKIGCPTRPKLEQPLGRKLLSPLLAGGIYR